jgi:hypothetical protein
MDDDIFIFACPVMETITEGFLVKRPEGEASPPAMGEGGSVSVGAQRMADGGTVMFLALHHPDGTTLITAMGRVGYVSLATAMNDMSRRIAAGEFERSEAKQ